MSNEKLIQKITQYLCNLANNDTQYASLLAQALRALQQAESSPHVVAEPYGWVDPDGAFIKAENVDPEFARVCGDCIPLYTAPQQTAPGTEAKTVAADYCACPPTECHGEGIDRCRWKMMGYTKKTTPPLNTQDGVDERAEFEKFLRCSTTPYYFHNRDRHQNGESYEGDDTEAAWQAWQARSNLSKNTLTRSDT